MLILSDVLTSEECYQLLRRRQQVPRRVQRWGGLIHDEPLLDVAPSFYPLVCDTVRRAAAMRFPELGPQQIDYAAYTVMSPGASHILHADALKLDGSPNHTPLRTCVGLLYLNTQGEHFEGGTFLAPGYGATVAPKAGTLVVMGAGLHDRHAVGTVDVGERHALAIWLRKTEGGG